MDNTNVDAVSATVEQISIPTYLPGVPNKNPMFLEKRVYQGSSGVVYPYAVIESVADEKQEKLWTAVVLENRYLKIMFLPEIGGRVQMALDKTNDYHFVYYNRVIKPALVGLTGPWIAGGIELNWPQHHRPTTFEPVDFCVTEGEDGSKTVWMSEIERMFRMKATVGFTLYPGRAYLELSVRLSNRTSIPQSFLWWANPAVHVHDDYQSVFPPDVTAVMDHGKRDVSSFPIATGTYYKIDYSPGTDISRYKNIPVPTSYMAFHSDYDFLGCYDHRAQAGMLHVADHSVVPGKKQWTWGTGDFGRNWERHLTDEDGPYIELMCGAYTDNQPDFSWLAPGEEKRFTQVFMPYKKIGPPSNASKDAVVSLGVRDRNARVGVYVTSAIPVRVELLCAGKIILDTTVELDPETPFVETIELPRDSIASSLMVRISSSGRELVRYAQAESGPGDLPAHATAPDAPRHVASIEELYLIGLHLEQYRHATFEPEPYYEEALRRDTNESRCNNALGRLLLRRGVFEEAEAYFRKAVSRLTERNPNPYDGEPYYNLGLSLRLQGRLDEAYAAFYKAAWNEAWRGAAFFELARIDCRRREFETAILHAQSSLESNRLNHRCRHLLVAAARRAGHGDLARIELDTALSLDPLDLGSLYESFLMHGDASYRAVALRSTNNAIEIALDYACAGLHEEATALLREARASDPLAHYYLGWFEQEAGNDAGARDWFTLAKGLSPDGCFPHAVEAILALKVAISIDPRNSRAYYCLGNLWYGHRRYAEAIDCWERARELEPELPTPHRNLGIAYANKRHDFELALHSYERAFSLDQSDARVLFEYDQLRKLTGAQPSQRFAFLESHRGLVEQRDDLSLERIALLNLLGRHEEAVTALGARRFHPWEGGEGKIVRQYLAATAELAKRALLEKRFTDALSLLRRAADYPRNLGEGKLTPNQDTQILWLLGKTYHALGEANEAEKSFRNAAAGGFAPTSFLYYNDESPDTAFYRGLAQRSLGNSKGTLFKRLEEHGLRHLDDTVTIDYFAVSLPDFLVFDQDPSSRNRLLCGYIAALGLLGQGRIADAVGYFETVLAEDPSNLDALIHLNLATGKTAGLEFLESL